ncbi:MAG TPA: DUF4192 domain-containing protein [Nocardioides sp.]|uniref:DUF4192 domain-containing protein n=1 Tax=Nocardioides sp. TaxID=35761 RepID=UPI002B64268D|nr:DUF4192 domain-containing protein [Nocardioides sp.]HQR27322.1 DUF4192 domain-containing protein [Nocardioides sp.]
MTGEHGPTLVARTPEDLLAMVPVVLGFHPQRSLVMLTFGGRQSFHARVDVPDSDHDVALVTDLLLGPALRHEVRSAVFVVYDRDSRFTRAVARRLVREFLARGIAVVDVLLADRGRWCRFEERRWGPRVPYDLTDHPFHAEAVWHGLVTHDSRAALAASVGTDPARLAAVCACLPAPGERSVAVAGGAAPDETGWAVATLDAAVREGVALEAPDAARMLTALTDLDVRDAVWRRMTRATARQHLRVWTDLVRAAPEGMVAAPAVLLGFAAWLGGDGALAWCALDRCLADEPSYSLGHLLARALSDAVPPSHWEDAGVGVVQDRP